MDRELASQLLPPLLVVILITPVSSIPDPLLFFLCLCLRYCYVPLESVSGIELSVVVSVVAGCSHHVHELMSSCILKNFCMLKRIENTNHILLSVNAEVVIVCECVASLLLLCFSFLFFHVCFLVGF